MKFAKPSLSIMDQIALLERRGMAIADRAKAEHYLQHISYYRLRAYWLPFEEPANAIGDHKFRAGTKLDDVVALYVFDRQLRLLVMDAIERIEISFRAAWAHHLAMTYGPHGYLDPAKYDQPVRYATDLTNLLDDLKFSKDTFIAHYNNAYCDPAQPPIWMTAEILTLGQLSKWISNLKLRADRKAIAKPYGIDEVVLTSAAHHLTHVRNICAHHARLWNKRFTVTMMIPQAPASLKLAMNPAADRQMYNTLVLLNYLMGIVAPGSDWKKRLVELINTCPFADQTAIGFPKDWAKLAAWR